MLKRYEFGWGRCRIDAPSLVGGQNNQHPSRSAKAALYAPDAYLLGVVEEARTFPTDVRAEAERFLTDITEAAGAADAGQLLADLRKVRQQFEPPRLEVAA